MPKTKIQVSFSNDASETPAEIRVYQQIGKDPWSDEGFDAEDFANALSQIPKNRAINLRINSAGGDVWEGMTIKSLLDAWPAKKTAIIDGVAASTASWMALGCDEIKMAAHGQMFIHDAWGVCAGNAKDMINTANRLDKTSDQIADMYATKTGKSRKAMRDMMGDGTLLTGEECKNLGLVDSLTTDPPVSNFCPDAVAAMRNRLKDWKTSVNNSATQLAGTGNIKTIMNKEKMLALLNKWGVTVPKDATDEQIMNLVEAGKPVVAPENKGTQTGATDQSAEIINLKNEFEKMKADNLKLTEANNAAKKLRITNEVQALIDNDQIPATLKDKAINRAMLDEEYLNELKAMPSKPPGTEPVNFAPDIRADASPKEVLRGFANFSEPMKAWQRGGSVPVKNLGEAAMARGLFFQKNSAALLQMMNTNTVATELKRSVILNDKIRDFARRLMMLSVFSTVYGNVPLEGTDKVEVPFYDLDSSAGVSFVTGTGYTTIGDTTTDKREVQIGEAVQGAGVFRDRKYVGLGFNSQEIARQPYLKIAELAGLKLERLADLVIQHILGIITAANFGAHALSRALNAINSDDLADLKLACKLWPSAGRTLVLDSGYDATLLKDTAFKFALNAASDSAIKEGRLNPRVFGFDYIENPTIPGNSENLAGFAVFKSAILVATAPVPPVEEVRNAGTTYEIVTEPTSGISFEYRTFGNNVTDAGTHVAELSYGAAKGNGNALKRIVTP